MDLRSLQRPLKGQYRKEPASAKVTLKAEGSQTGSPLACSIDLGRAIYEAQAHQGVGGSGQGAYSGDLLLGALAACAQLTRQMVAEGLQIPVKSIHVTIEGNLDLRGTLGISNEVPVGFHELRMGFDIDAPEATAPQLAALKEKNEQYCVVLQTLARPPKIVSNWSNGVAGARG